jgi:hypothetical protein
MKRRLNYTNRRHLTSEHVKISLEEQPGKLPSRFTATFSIPTNWKLNPDAKIYIEGYVASTAMRFPFGTVNEIIHPVDTTLRDIDAGNVLFRVKIVDESGEIGKLLASAEEIRPTGQDGEESEGFRSFFPLVMANLGQAIWNVEITKSDRPRLLLNNQIPGLRERLLSDPLLQGAILPAAMQHVLGKVLYSSEFDDADWASDWKNFVESLCGEVFPPDDEELDEEDVSPIIENAVVAFIETKRFAEKAKVNSAGDTNE